MCVVHACRDVLQICVNTLKFVAVVINFERQRGQQRM
jgi:hypothetical protein